jgi:hypothetical protein
MKFRLQPVRVIQARSTHTRVINKAQKIEIENIRLINFGLAAEVNIIIDELEFCGCLIWRDEAGHAVSVVAVPEIISFRTARCAVPFIKVGENIKHAIAMMADDILPKAKPCGYDQTNCREITLNHPPFLRVNEADLLKAFARIHKKKRWTIWLD